MLINFYTKTFNIGNQYYFINKLSSYTDIRVIEVRADISSGSIVFKWNQTFNFCGDILNIEKNVYIGQKIQDKTKKTTFFNKYPTTENPRYVFYRKMFSYEEYLLKFGLDKTWMDYCEYIAEGTESKEQFDYVKNTGLKILETYHNALKTN